MPTIGPVQHRTRSRTATGSNSRLLAVLLLILLSGLPQIGISLSGIDLRGESIRPAPLTRSLLLDKILAEAAIVSPPAKSEFPPTSFVPPASPFRARPGSDANGARVKPSTWLLNLRNSLYRHHSSYV